MPPSFPTRIAALQRDVTRFHDRLAHLAADTPPATLTPDSPVVDRAFATAAALESRAASIAESAAWRGASRADERTVATGYNAARTAAQLLGTGPVNRDEVTVSTTDPRSARSAATWLAAAAGSDLPNVRIVGSIPPPAARLVADRLENVPELAVRQLDAQGRRSTLFSGSLTDVHGFRRLRGVQPRGWPEGSTWDQVPGVGTASGMASNPNRERKGSGHGEDSLSLHELGHVIDIAMARPDEWSTSTSDRWKRGPWREMRRVGAQSDYFTKHPEEWYAEAVMKYSRTPQTHASLARWYPDTYRFLETQLGEPRFE